MAFYWRGKIPLEEPMFTAFWDKSSDALRAHALEFIGRSLLQTEGDIPKEIIQRLKNLWEYRLKKAFESPDEHKEEMGAFGWWFVSQKFGTDWSLKHLLQSLKIADKIEPADMIFEQLANIVKNFPSESVECLRKMIERD
jgi:hypothetical protein